MNAHTVRLQTGALVQFLEQTPVSKRHEVLMQHLSAMLRDLLALDASEPFRPDQRLFELGLQSRNVIELKDRLEATFAVGLPVTLFFRQTTLEMLTTHLLTAVLKLAPPSQTSPHTPLQPFVPTAMEQLERLSEAEAEARLLDKLAEVQKRIEP